MFGTRPVRMSASLSTPAQRMFGTALHARATLHIAVLRFGGAMIPDHSTLYPEFDTINILRHLSPPIFFLPSLHHPNRRSQRSSSTQPVPVKMSQQNFSNSFFSSPPSNTSHIQQGQGQHNVRLFFYNRMVILNCFALPCISATVPYF